MYKLRLGHILVHDYILLCYFTDCQLPAYLVLAHHYFTATAEMLHNEIEAHNI